MGTKLITDGKRIVDDPRPAQWDELNAAIGNATAARRADDLDTYYWWLGVQQGYLAAFSPWTLWRDDLARARRNLFARTEHLDELLPRLDRFGIREPQRRDTIRATGTLWGFSQATAERDDAETCTATCAGRILTELDDDAVDTWHGWFCNEDCHLSYDGMHCCKAEKREGLS